MKYQLSEKEKEQATELNKIDRKIRKLQHDIDYSDASLPVNHIKPHGIDASQLDEVRDTSCLYYRNCTLINCLSCKKLK